MSWLTTMLLSQAAMKGGGDAPIGTSVAGYAGPDQGPFRCDNCAHFSPSRSMCDQPKVVSDPAVRGKVEAKGCCNYFRPRTA